jgi:hypothetical protein
MDTQARRISAPLLLFFRIDVISNSWTFSPFAVYHHPVGDHDAGSASVSFTDVIKELLNQPRY